MTKGRKKLRAVVKILLPWKLQASLELKHYYTKLCPDKLKKKDAKFCGVWFNIFKKNL